MIDIDEKLHKEIKEYCKANNLKIGQFVTELLRKAFIVEKYGDRPPMFANKKPVKTIKVEETTTTTEKEVTTTTTPTPEEATLTKRTNIKRRTIK